MGGIVTSCGVVEIFVEELQTEVSKHIQLLEVGRVVVVTSFDTLAMSEKAGGTIAVVGRA